MSWINRFGLTNEEAKVINQYSAPERSGEALTPGMFEGSLDAMGKSFGMQFEASKSSLSEAMALKVEDPDYNLIQQEDPFAPELNYDKDAVADRLRRDAREARLKIKNDYTPNPETTGTAAMVLYGLTGSVAKGIGYTVAAGGNPIIGGALFGADLGRYEKDKLQDKGVDSETATRAGLITGVTNAVGMALPASLGTSYLKSAIFGGLINPATDITEQSAIKFVLDNANYADIAKEYDPFDPVNLVTSGGMGVLFGAIGARGARVRLAREAREALTTTVPAQTEEGRMNRKVLESIQNRDRSGKESRLQMQQIAQAPDFNRLRNGATLGEGTPVIAYLPDNSSAVLGKQVIVSDTNGGRTTMRYALVEASEVLTSNSADGSLNADFTNPEVEGARAIAGNGRIAGLQAAYRGVHATEYRKELANNAKEFGISRRAVKKMREPILVRIMDDADVKEGVGELSNRTGTLKLNPAEQAAQDARNVRLEEVEFTKDGEFTTRSMDEFVRRTPDKEGLIGSNGEILYDNVTRRMRPAVFAAAFSDTRIINRFIANDPADAKIMNVLQSVAPEVVRLKKIGGDFDFSGDLMEAVADYMQTKQEAKKANGNKVEGEITGSLLESTPAQEWFKEILLSKNPERLKDVLARFHEVASQESGGEGFFGSVSREEVFNQVKSEFGAFDRAVDAITPSAVDSAMELRAADVIEGDQPSGMKGDINKSIADEKKAREQIDNGEPVNVSGEGVDPEALMAQFSSFKDRVFNQLLGAGFKEKLAAYSADIHEAFFRTLGDRLGIDPAELARHYGLEIRRGEGKAGQSFLQNKTAEQKLSEESKRWSALVEALKDKPKQPVLMLTQTPLAMRLVGADFRELYAHPHLFDGIFPGAKKSSPNHHSHVDMDTEVLKQLPNALADPVAIYRDPQNRSTVFALELRDKGGNAVMVPVAFNATGNKGTINLVKSAFGRGELYYEAQGMNSTILYANKEKCRRWFPSSGADSLFDSNADGSSVLTEKDLVNLRDRYPGYYQSEKFTPDQSLIDNAKATFGVTDDIREAGYVLPDGTMLDFSGRHWGLDDAEARGQRQVDHIDVGEVDGIQDATGNEMYDFMAQTGAMRVSMNDGNSVASIARAPTAQQLAVLGRATNRKYLALSFNTPDGRIVSDIEFESSSLGKIEKFLDDAQKKYERGETSGAYAQDVKGMYTPAERMITLFGTADESTFMHESGHYFLDIMTDVAGRADAPEQIRADIQTLMDWFGLKDLNEWKGLSLEEKRQFHEQFARGFERYLRDGEAPSSKLEAIFKQFKDWLISIYKSSQDLDVELTPEVRDVYDRMLATDKEIAAKREADAPGLFGEQVSQAADSLLNSSTLSDETKAVIKDGLDLLGIKTEQSKESNPLYGVMSDDEFVRNRFDLDMERYGDTTVLDDKGNEITVRELVADQMAAAEKLENDANGMSRAALCMFGNNAFD